MSKKNIKVSVIVAVYNQENFIGRCLRSLLHQTYAHDEYEIIVVNDGSTDKTQYALSQFVDPFESNVKVINNDVNSGLPFSVNKAISESQGEYIVRVDSDDFVNKNFINILSYYLDVNGEAGAVACDYYLVDDMENVLARVSCEERPIACGIMFRKSNLLEVGLYDESFRMNEEIDLKHRFTQNFILKRIELPLYRYRRHAFNMTNDLAGLEIYNQMFEEKHGISIEMDGGHGEK